MYDELLSTMLHGEFSRCDNRTRGVETDEIFSRYSFLITTQNFFNAASSSGVVVTCSTKKPCTPLSFAYFPSYLYVLPLYTQSFKQETLVVASSHTVTKLKLNWFSFYSTTWYYSKLCILFSLDLSFYDKTREIILEKGTSASLWVLCLVLVYT